MSGLRRSAFHQRKAGGMQVASAEGAEGCSSQKGVIEVFDMAKEKQQSSPIRATINAGQKFNFQGLELFEQLVSFEHFRRFNQRARTNSAS